MKDNVFWDIMPFGSYKNQHSSVTLVVTRATRRNIPEDGILYEKTVCFYTHTEFALFTVARYGFWL
jgi:hypothetical protein